MQALQETRCLLSMCMVSHQWQLWTSREQSSALFPWFQSPNSSCCRLRYPSHRSLLHLSHWQGCFRFLYLCVSRCLHACLRGPGALCVESICRGSLIWHSHSFFASFRCSFGLSHVAYARESCRPSRAARKPRGTQRCMGCARSA